MRKTWSHVCSATVVGARSKASRRTVIPELGRLHGEEVLDGLGDCALEAAGGAWHLLLLAGKPQRGGRGHLQLQVPRENQGVHQGLLCAAAGRGEEFRRSKTAKSSLRDCDPTVIVESGPASFVTIRDDSAGCRSVGSVKCRGPLEAATAHQSAGSGGPLTI